VAVTALGEAAMPREQVQDFPQRDESHADAGARRSNFQPGLVARASGPLTAAARCGPGHVGKGSIIEVAIPYA
jgi:hypothetical protein